MKSFVKRSIICRNIHPADVNKSIVNTYCPKAGDMALFEVVELGRHTSIQNELGHTEFIFPGDHIWAAFGHRYASNQFEGYVPNGPMELYHMLGKGGAVGEVKSAYARIEKDGITTLRLIGYAADLDGEVINTIFYRKPLGDSSVIDRFKNRIILSIGASMDSGKTTTAAMACRGLRRSGLDVAFMKLTGTVYTKDKMLCQDAGAWPVLDFSDFGFPSTYLAPFEQLDTLLYSMLAEIERSNPDYLVVEIADGLLQRETDYLLRHPEFLSCLAGIVYSCGDSLSGIGGLDYLEKMGLHPMFVSGLITISPLMVQELTEKVSLPVVNIEQLQGDYLALLLQKKVVPMNVENHPFQLTRHAS
jgi:hypothetical protein